jgi:hypothetical protein
MTARSLTAASKTAGIVPRTGRYHAPPTGPRMTDARLTALLTSKPEDDDVPLAAWWFITTSLESAVSVRRDLEGVEPLAAAGLKRATHRAQDAARAALDELEERHGRRFIAPQPAPAHIDPLSVLRCTIHQLARLTVRSQFTPAEQLSSRLLAHIDALSRCVAAHTTATPSSPRLVWVQG